MNVPTSHIVEKQDVTRSPSSTCKVDGRGGVSNSKILSRTNCRKSASPSPFGRKKDDTGGRNNISTTLQDSVIQEQRDECSEMAQVVKGSNCQVSWEIINKLKAQNKN